MPKIAILADIHANLPALVAVIKEAKVLGCDKIVQAGDLVGYGAFPGECVRLIMREGINGVLGNHDQWALGLHVADPAKIPVEWARDEMMASLLNAASSLSSVEFEWLQTLPFFIRLPGAMLVHASLDDPRRWFYIERLSDALASIKVVRGHARHLVFCGHTHVQRIFCDPEDNRQVSKIDEWLFSIPQGLATVVTVGSVGQPRSMDGDPRAAWVIWDSSERTVQFLRTEYQLTS